LKDEAEVSFQNIKPHNTDDGKAFG